MTNAGRPMHWCFEDNVSIATLSCSTRKCRNEYILLCSLVQLAMCSNHNMPASTDNYFILTKYRTLDPWSVSSYTPLLWYVRQCPTRFTLHLVLHVWCQLFPMKILGGCKSIHKLNYQFSSRHKTHSQQNGNGTSCCPIALHLVLLGKPYLH